MKPYRKNVGIVIFNTDGLTLAGNRVQFPECFQYPQGGIDENEMPLDAAYRELYEEVGLKLSDPPVAELSEWIYYDFPESIPDHLKKYQGQMQKWFFFFWSGNLSELNLTHHEQEFLTVRWMDIEEVASQIVPFKKPVYEILKHNAARIFPEFLLQKSIEDL